MKFIRDRIQLYQWWKLSSWLHAETSLNSDIIRHVFTCNLNMSFNLPWIMSNCVKIVQNSVEVKRMKLKCKHKKVIAVNVHVILKNFIPWWNFNLAWISTRLHETDPEKVYFWNISFRKYICFILSSRFYNSTIKTINI